MSTKTTLKRIALVAVSALGFGVMSVVPAKAATYTSGITLGWSAMTVVGNAEGTTNAGFFYVDTTQIDNSLAASATGYSLAKPLQSTGESMVVEVITAPSGLAADLADLTITPVTLAQTVGGSFTEVTDGITNDQSVQLPEGTAAIADYRSGNGSFSTTESLNNEYNRYWFAVNPASSGGAIGAGKYTIRVRVYNGLGSTVESTLTVKFVSEIANAGAVITTAKTGSIATVNAYDYTANTSVRATLRDADGGRIQNGQSLSSAENNGWQPTMRGYIYNENDTTGNREEVTTTADSGVTAVDHVECGTGGAAACSDTPTASTWAVSVSNALSANLAAAIDGVYGIQDGGVSTTADLNAYVRFELANTSVAATIAVPVIARATATSAGTTLLMTAAGMAPANDLVVTPTCTSGACTATYDLPLSTKTATLTYITDGASGEALTSTVSWNSKVASADVTPAVATSGTATTVYLNSSSQASQTVTNATPLDGATATVVLTGFATPGHKVTVTINWEAPDLTTATVTDPVDGVYVKTGSTSTISVIAKDQFGNPMSGEKFIPSLGSGSANYSETDTYAAIQTDAAGVATWSITDAAAVADDEENITFTSLTDGTVTASIDLTYKATLPTVSSIQSFYNQDFSLADTTIATAVPATGITNSGAALEIKMDRNQSYDLSANTEASANDMIAIRVRALTSAGAAAAGASLTLTAPVGGHVLNSSGLPATSRTVAVGAAGDAYFRIMATGTGTLSWTVTSGSTSLGSIAVKIADQPAGTARFVTLTGASTGTANGEGVPMTVQVTDRFGNGVKNVTLSVTASGVGSFMGGATSQSFTTDASGKYTFLANSYNSAGGSATYSVGASTSSTNDTTSSAGYYGATAIDSSVKAGNSSATATITFAAGSNASAVAAEAATDAALEAIDAANAATDAANLAAEAADAATVAAEEARDAADAATSAVEALASEVATLMAALKAQITTLAKTVAKIAKKVKA